MLRLNHRLAGLVAASLLCSACATEVGEDDVDAQGVELVQAGPCVVNTNGVNLRASPSTSARILDRLIRGTRCTALGPKKSANGYVFVKVKVGAVEGWIAEPYLSALPPLELADAVAFLGREVALRSPGTALSISVHVLGSDERAELASSTPRPSASSAKAVWAAAALARHAASEIDQDALPVFRRSDNDAAGRLIDFAGGAGAINDFYDRAGMGKSGLLHWNTEGHVRVDPDEPRLLGDDNYFTARDATTFLEMLAADELLPPDKTATLLSWMTESPNSGTGGWLPARLPEPAKSRAAHKAGWLPPECCESRALNEIGIVEARAKRYAIAILASKGQDWAGKQAPFVEYASCVIYRAIDGAESLDCE